MSVVPFPGYSLCRCGNGVAVIPVTGAVVCSDCADDHRGKQIPAADIFLVDPDESPKLDDLLTKLTKVAP